MDLKKISIVLSIIVTLGVIVGVGIKYDKNIVKAADYQLAQAGIN
jgi:hypothetical protein